MDKLVIHGGRPLRGQIRVSGSKNAALPILMATLLCDTPARVANAPVSLRDIRTTLRLLDILGCRTAIDAAPSGPVVVVERNGLKPEAPYDLVKTMRASVLCLGPLLALLGEAKVALPGGCAIGARPVDQHLKGFEALGARFDLDSGYVHGTCSRLRGTRFAFDFPTVGGVENLLMAAVLAEGETVLENCAREPEIVDLANFLIACGARITGAGTDVIHVQGVSSLSGCDYRIMPDRIEAGTYLVAAAITDGELRLSDCPMDVLDSVVLKLGAMSVAVERAGPGGSEVVVKRSCAPRCPTRCVDVTTRPFPGFPTDMQAQIMALMAVSEGAGVIEETIFENRFMHVQELARMGADITLKGRSAMVRGVKTLRGAPVMASDLRASASLVLAGLAAKGTTEVQRIYHLDRGYERMEEKLSQVGAAIERAPE